MGRLKKKTQIRYYILFYDLEVCQHSRVHVYLLKSKRKQAFVCSSVVFVSSQYPGGHIVCDKQENLYSPNPLKIKLKGI